MRARRRGIEEVSVSFLDVICCGFGAIILLLMITKVAEPLVLEQSVVDLDGQLASRENALFEIRGQITEVRRQVTDAEGQLDDTLLELARLNQLLTRIMGQYQATESEADTASVESQKLAAARQSLTDEMERLLGQSFRRDNDLVGGIAVDSEYIIFVIDTSGSMFNGAWPQVLRKVEETLAVYPIVKGIQVMNDEGEYMFNGFRGEWIPDSPARRRSILQTLANWNAPSDSSPVEGIYEAINTYYDPTKKIGIYVFGDDFSGESVEVVVDAVERMNQRDERGQRLVRINAVGFPVHLQRPNARIYRFAALMRELAYRNDGTFVGLSEFQ